VRPRAMGLLLLAGALAAALAGCSLPGEERTFTAGDVTVLDGSGLVTILDYTILRNAINQPPGPSAFAP